MSSEDNMLNKSNPNDKILKELWTKDFERNYGNFSNGAHAKKSPDHKVIPVILEEDQEYKEKSSNWSEQSKLKELALQEKFSQHQRFISQTFSQKLNDSNNASKKNNRNIFNQQENPQK